MLQALVEYVREQYQIKFGNAIVVAAEEDSEGNIEGNSEEAVKAIDDKPSVDKFVFIAGFQTMIAELSALENSNDPETTWHKIQSELTPLFENYLEPILAQSDMSGASGGDFKEQLDNALKRVDNLEQFKQLYFELQAKLSKSLADIESLNQQVIEQAEGSDNFDAIRQIIEKNKTHYVEMGQMIGMDKEQHHESVAGSMDYSEAIINERKDEIKRLKNKIAQQFEDIWKLQNRASGNAEGDNSTPPDVAELSAGIDTISRNLKDAEMCIETMDMEIQTLTAEITSLKSQLKESGGEQTTDQSAQEAEAVIARHAQESKELMSCITGLEDDNQEQYNRIKALEEELGSSAEFKEKYLKLEAEYSAMEAKYLETMSK